MRAATASLRLWDPSLKAHPGQGLLRGLTWQRMRDKQGARQNVRGIWEETLLKVRGQNTEIRQLQPIRVQRRSLHLYLLRRRRGVRRVPRMIWRVPRMARRVPRPSRSSTDLARESTF